MLNDVGGESVYLDDHEVFEEPPRSRQANVTVRLFQKKFFDWLDNLIVNAMTDPMAPPPKSPLRDSKWLHCCKNAPTSGSRRSTNTAAGTCRGDAEIHIETPATATDVFELVELQPSFPQERKNVETESHHKTMETNDNEDCSPVQGAEENEKKIKEMKQPFASKLIFPRDAASEEEQEIIFTSDDSYESLINESEYNIVSDDDNDYDDNDDSSDGFLLLDN